MTDPDLVTITAIGSEGDGVVTRPGGTPQYIPYALPGEVWDVASPERPSLRIPLPDRQPDRCSQFGRCGGCMAHHMPDELYAAWKQGLVQTALRHHGLPEDKVAPLVRIAPRTRRRAVLTAERSRTGFVVGFHRARSHHVEPMRDCAVLAPALVAALPQIASLATVLLPGHDEGRFIAVATDTGLDVTLVEPQVDPGAAARAEVARIAEAAKLARVSIGSSAIVSRSRPELRFGDVLVSPPPGVFLQAVEEAERAMRDLVLAGVGKARSVADLFAGLGTFSLSLARTARVTAIDTDADALASLAAAARSATRLKPIETLRRDLMREPLSPRELSSFDAVVFDPPRAGAKAQAERLARSKVGRVVAVSCNPATLARDLAVLIAGGFALGAVTPVDQFVFSNHVEAVAVLTRR